MSSRLIRDPMEAFKYARDMREAREGWLIDQAFADILAGKFESEAVHEAMKLGHHEDYTKLKETYDAAALAARHSGGTL